MARPRKTVSSTVIINYVPPRRAKRITWLHTIPRLGIKIRYTLIWSQDLKKWQLWQQKANCCQKIAYRQQEIAKELRKINSIKFRLGFKTYLTDTSETIRFVKRQSSIQVITNNDNLSPIVAPKPYLGIIRQIKSRNLQGYMADRYLSDSAYKNRHQQLKTLIRDDEETRQANELWLLNLIDQTLNAIIVFQSINLPTLIRIRSIKYEHNNRQEYNC